MKSNIKENIIEVINSFQKDDKHKAINVTVIIAFKIHSKTLKFMHNFLTHVPHPIKNNHEIILFDKDLFDKVSADAAVKSRVVFGPDIEVKKIKKSLYCAIGLKLADKYKSVLNKKSIAPNNIGDYDNADDEKIANGILAGEYIKVYQMNNTVNFKCGDLDMDPEAIADNLIAIITFLKAKSMNVKHMYVSQCMKKSSKILAKK